jgi:starch synthase
MSATIKVLYLAAEAEPFIKVGGLADVAGSLPIALRSLSYQASGGVELDVRLVLPLHAALQATGTSLSQVADYSIHYVNEKIPVRVFESSSSGMPVYFIDGPFISNPPSVYSTDPALDRKKFTFFSLAALELMHHIDWRPEIIHANDWHTALAINLSRSRGLRTEIMNVHTLITVHNLPYMGGDCTDVLSSFNIHPFIDESLPKWAQTQLLPLGLSTAEVIVPVSPTYTQEILTPEYGCGLDPFLGTIKDRLTGILNGLDEVAWNPETDPALMARFTIDSLLDRSVNKSTLQKSLDLKEDSRIPLLVTIGRINEQKGMDITFEALRLMTDFNWQFVILGSGDPDLEDAARRLQTDFPDRVRAIIRYDAALGRLLYGGSDLLLMPSRYEPCGLAQMIAMRYGCIPVVRATGGLKDTVRDGKTGFLFQEAETGSMVDGLKRALDVYTNPEKWQCIQRSGMKEDFSWSRSARRYASLYRSLVSN